MAGSVRVVQFGSSDGGPFTLPKTDSDIVPRGPNEWLRVLADDRELFAVAGLWRQSAEWGAVYTMVMTESSPQMADVHDRMPVILQHGDWQAQ